MTLRNIAAETLQIVEQGRYAVGSSEVDVRALVDEAVKNTRLYDPVTVAALVTSLSAGAQASRSSSSARPAIEVTGETSAAACLRLVREGAQHLVVLNFASAKNPGGGFLSGAKAQEEDLARCSALYTCQLAAPRYYAANRATRSMLYTDHLIYSPAVPFFRGEDHELLEEPFLASVITSPAPNAGAVRNRDAAADAKIVDTLRSRGAQVLAVARAQGHRTLVLGAWGCGVFRNDPVAVADMFAEHLESRAFASAFERVVFAVYDRTANQANLGAFQRRFSK